MTRVLLATSVAAALLAPARGEAFLRTESTSGACLAWPQRRVGFVANADGLPGQQPVCVASAPLEKLQAALDTWNLAARIDAPPCTDLQLVLGGATSRTDVGASQDARTDVNLVVWRRGSCEALAPASDPCWASDAGAGCPAEYNCWDYDDKTIALTTTSYLVSTGEIVDADIELRAWDGGTDGFGVGASGWYFTCFDSATTPARACSAYGEADCVGIDLEGVLAHELGHAIGIADQYTDPSGTMYGYATNGQTLKPTLATDDVEAVCSIYPTGASTPQCGMANASRGTASAGGSGGGGCNSAGAVPGIAALVGTLLTRRRRRAPMQP